MNINDNPLESLEFLDLLSGEDPIDAPAYDPNQNIAPDILSGEPLNTGEEDDETDNDDNSNPAPAPAPAPAKKVEPPIDDEPADDPIEIGRASCRERV